jgi:hypothetical protein
MEDVELHLLRSIGNCTITLLDYEAFEEIRQVLVSERGDA